LIDPSGLNVVSFFTSANSSEYVLGGLVMPAFANMSVL
jgi:hypothetical protein